MTKTAINKIKNDSFGKSLQSKNVKNLNNKKWRNNTFFEKFMNIFTRHKDDGLTHAEAAIYVLKSTKKELHIKEIFDKIKHLRLKRDLNNILSLYSCLMKLRNKGVVDATRTGYWKIK